MDAIMGVEGEKIPDTPDTPGRDKIVWQSPSDPELTVTHENHMYDATAPDFHKMPHYHVGMFGWPLHLRWFAGEVIPFTTPSATPQAPPVTPTTGH